MDTLNDIWKQVLAICKSKVSDVMFSMWLEPLEFQKLDDTTAVFLVNAEFRKNIILSRFKELIEDAFMEVIGFRVDLDIIVDQTFTDGNKIINAQEKNNRSAANGENQQEIQDDYLTKRKPSDSFTFDNFITGQSNIFAYNIAKSVAQRPGKQYNPLLIYGNSGLGKTHLMLAIYNELKKNFPDYIILYTTGENFLVDMVESMAKKSTSEFHRKYRNVDVLLVDDIQVIQKGVSVQEEFFHTFNALEPMGKHIIMTSDVPPKEMAVLDDRLRTRFEMGIIADIQPPDIDMRKAIILKKCSTLGITINDTQIELIASKIKSNVRQLEGTVKKIEAFKRVYGTMPTNDDILNMVKEVTTDSQPVSVIINNIFSVVSEIYGVSKEDMTSNKRDSNISNARNICMYVIKEVTDMTLNEIGTYFGRSHSTVLHSVKLCQEKADRDTAFKVALNNIVKQVKES